MGVVIPEEGIKLLAISRQQKEKIVEELKQRFARSQALILVDYRGLPVSEMRRLRGQLRDEDCALHVVKNRLAKLAAQQAGFPAVEPLLSGPLAIAFCYGDVVSAAKALTAYATETKLLAIRGGILGPRVLDPAGVEELARLPSREMLLARLVGQASMPLYSLVGVLAASLRNLVYVVRQRMDQLESQSEPAP